ncbi:type 4a pilus biogenesis protein PilO [Candidatus Woesebacteria bacterium]|nr:type 4a pilus biogenesis protein PilO [Candidatus Woesebacteria bacterium]
MKLTSGRYTQDLRRYYRIPAVQTSLTLVLSLFVLAFFITFALRPTILSILDLRKNIALSQKTLQSLETKVVNLNKIANILESIKPSLPNLNEDIPNLGAKYSPLVVAVENIAVQTGVKLESESIGSTLLFSRIVSPFAPHKNQEVLELPFSVRVTGSYFAVNEFMTKLLAMSRIIYVDSVTLSRETTAKNNAGIVALNLSGNAYYLADESLLNKALETGKAKK